MKLYAAIDLHSNNSVLVNLDEHDQIVYERRLPNELPFILAEQCTSRLYGGGPGKRLVCPFSTSLRRIVRP